MLGNHDHESNAVSEVRQVLVDAGVKLLDGETVEILGVGFAGVKKASPADSGEACPGRGVRKR